LTPRLQAEKEYLARLQANRVEIGANGEDRGVVRRAVYDEETGRYVMRETGVRLTEDQMRNYSKE